MTMYLVSYDDTPGTIVCKTRADAEEFLLSLAEEDAYENMLADMDVWDSTAEEFIQHYKDRLTLNRKRSSYLPYWEYSHVWTTNGFILYSFGIRYMIYEIEVLD